MTPAQFFKPFLICLSKPNTMILTIVLTREHIHIHIHSARDGVRQKTVQVPARTYFSKFLSSESLDSQLKSY
jgi:hypothetical protein